jgi:type IV secretory pathway VirB2 component (pilin)
MDRPFVQILNWIAVWLSGPVALGLGIIAVSLLGFAILSGHLDKRCAIRVLLGLSLVFAAPTLSLALRDIVTGEEFEADKDQPEPKESPPKSICWTCG